MSFRFVEISEDGRHLSLERGFLVVSTGGAEIGRVPLDDIAALIVTGHGASHSSNLLLNLAERRAPVILCGPNFRPRAVLWSVEAHHRQAGRMQAQAAAPARLKNRLWKELVQAKLRNQGAVLEALGLRGSGLQLLAARVRSGDPENLEAQGAQRYWPLILGAGFKRDPELEGPNSLLNYGYAVLRAALARAVMGAGLHPSLGLHHRNAFNSFCLVDDLIEPFRPVADYVVRRILDDPPEQPAEEELRLTPAVKRRLSALASLDLPTPGGLSPLSQHAQALASSLAQALEEGRGSLKLPPSPLPLELEPGGGPA